MTGPGVPDHTADDVTWTSRADTAGCVGVVVGVTLGVVVATGVDASDRRTAVIASDDVR